MKTNNWNENLEICRKKHVLDIRRCNVLPKMSSEIEISREESERVMGTRFNFPDAISKTVMADSVLSNNTACISRV